MGTTAFIMMVGVQGLVALITFMFFYKVLKTPPKREPDSYEDNDDIEERQ
jgi:hypothetical protein